MATALETERLVLRPFSPQDFDHFVTEMLTDPRVVAFYYSFRDEVDPDRIRRQAQDDFWDQFEDSRANHKLEIWAACESAGDGRFVGWSGLLFTSLSERYGAPELQYMISGNMHGKGYATELAREVLRHAHDVLGLNHVIATVDIPNVGSIRVLEKLGFQLDGQIEAYGSDQMYLYRLQATDVEVH
jgi:ribosomal-protein-alanine N-acetyltransferase